MMRKVLCEKIYLKNENYETDLWDGISCTNDAWQCFYVQNIHKMEGEGPGKFLCPQGDPFTAQRYCIARRTLDLLPTLARLGILVFSLLPGPYWSRSTDTSLNKSRFCLLLQPSEER